MSFRIDVGGDTNTQKQHEAVERLTRKYVRSLARHCNKRPYGAMQGTDPDGNTVSIDLAAPLVGAPSTEKEMHEHHRTGNFGSKMEH